MSRAKRTRKQKMFRKKHRQLIESYKAISVIAKMVGLKMRTFKKFKKSLEGLCVTSMNPDSFAKLVDEIIPALQASSV